MKSKEKTHIQTYPLSALRPHRKPPQTPSSSNYEVQESQITPSLLLSLSLTLSFSDLHNKHKNTRMQNQRKPPTKSLEKTQTKRSVQQHTYTATKMKEPESTNLQFR